MRKLRAGWPLFWQLVAITFTVMLVTLVVAGLAGLAGFVLYAVALNASASNK